MRPTLDQILSGIPEMNSLDGWKNAKLVFKEKLRFVYSSQTGDLLDLLPAFWQDVFDALYETSEGKILSDKTGYRARQILLQMSQILIDKKIISVSSIPDIEVSSKHYRRQIFRIDRLHDQRSGEFSRLQDFEKLITYYTKLYDGRMGMTKPFDLENLKNALLLSCLLTGFIQEDPVNVLSQLTWKDIQNQNYELIWMPIVKRGSNDRLGGFWFECGPFTKLLFSCFRFRHFQITTALSEKIFESDSIDRLRKRSKSLLTEMCNKSKTPVLSVQKLIQLERYHLRTLLKSNLPVSVISGIVKINPLVREIAGPVYNMIKTGKRIDVGIDITEKSLEEEVIETNEEFSEEKEIESLKQYSNLLIEIRHHINDYFKNNSNEKNQELKEFILNNINSIDKPNRILAWLLKWVVEMKIKDKTRIAYWAASLRLLSFFPTLSLEEFNHSVFSAFVNSDMAPSSISLTKTAWKKFYFYLKENQIDVPQINWNKIRIPKKYTTVSLITNEDFEFLVTNILSDELALAAKLSYWGGLRVSEVCKLRVCDLDILEGHPLMYVLPSKGEKPRKVSLANLDTKQLNELRTLQKNRLESDGYLAHLIVNASNESLESKFVSEGISLVLNLHVQNMPKKRFHQLRSAALDIFYYLSNDIRYPAQQAGHSFVETTCQHYEHKLDLYASNEIRKWNNPLFNDDMHIPIVNLANLLGYSSTQIRNILNEYNRDKSHSVICRKEWANLPDGKRPEQGGHPTQYLSVLDAVRLVDWMTMKKNSA